MSNEMTLFGGKGLPSYLKNVEMDATTKALAGSGGGTGHRISIKGGVYRMIVDGKQVAENEDRAMNVVVVAASPFVNRQYYAGAYDENVIAGPDCASQDGKTPMADVKSPQSSSCDTCKQNIAGSGQGESRACRYQQRLAVVLEGEIDGPVYQLALPATSLFGKGEPNNVKMPLQAYARFLAQNGAPITAVVTEMRFDTQAATPKLTFKAARALTEEEFTTATAQGASSEARSAIELTVFQQDTKNKTAAASKPAAKAKPAPEPEPEVAPEGEAGAEPEEAAPKVVTKAKPAAPAGKRPAADIIAEWDAD